ncbi:NACHT and WD repeat domain-containing protein [Nostoc sp. CALU 546]|uniref:NACHT and WD repeat domain-containing protein n=1 Tax=Nostoc sp. CALU 546 TaxID=1867241 RepID=UPI003B66D241
MSDNQFQDQDSVLQNVQQYGEHSVINFAPTQIGTNIETQILYISAQIVTQGKLEKLSPYKSLKRFNFKDRDYFFGRDPLIARLLKAVNKNSFSLVLGASGSGKSSLVRAGLIPELQKSLSSEKFYDFIFTPNLDPFESFYRCLLNEEKDYKFSESQVVFVKKGLADTFSKVISTLKKDGQKWLIFVDQFEQLFTRSYDADIRRNFIESLVKVALSGDKTVRIVLAMRSDFLEQFSFYPSLGAIANDNIHLVTQMYPEQLQQAIEQPAAKHGVVFQEGLVKQIIKDVEGQSGYLPLLQYTLDLLWEYECKTLGTDSKPRIENRRLNTSSYNALEGVRGALQKRVNDIYSRLKQDEQTASKQIFLKLVNIVETESGSKAVSRRAYRNEFVGKSVEETLKKFVDENLLVSGYEYISEDQLKVSGTQERLQCATIELSHEIILSSWDDLKRWLVEEKEAIILKNWLAGETMRWLKILAKDKNKAKEELLKGIRLEQIIDLKAKNAFTKLGGLTKYEVNFIDASIYQEQRERQAKRLTKAIIFLGLFITGIALFSGSQWQKAQINEILALQANAETLLLSNQDLDALIQGLSAGKKLKKTFLLKQDTRNNLENKITKTLLKILYSIKERNRWQANERKIKELYFSSDGKLIKTVGQGKFIDFDSGGMGNIEPLDENDIVKNWDLSGKLVQNNAENVNFSCHKRVKIKPDTTISIESLTGTINALLPNGNLIKDAYFDSNKNTLITSGEQSLSLWGLSPIFMNENMRFRKIKELKTTSEVNDICFSPNDELAVTGEGNGQVSLWDLSSKQIKSFTELNFVPSFKVTVSPNRKLIAAADTNGIIRLSNLSGKIQKEFFTSKGLVFNITFNSESNQAAISTSQGTTIWNLSGEKLAEFPRENSLVCRVIFSPDNTKFVTIGIDGSVVLYKNNPQKIDKIKILSTRSKGHVDKCTTSSVAAFSPIDKIIATGSSDSTITLWDYEGNQKNKLKGIYSVTAIAFSNNGKKIAASGSYGSTLVWDLSNNSVDAIAKLPGQPTLRAKKIIFSPDSNLIATVGVNGNASLWDLNGNEIAKLSNLYTYTGDGIEILKFSPDGNLIATIESISGLIVLWDISGNKLTELTYPTGGVIQSNLELEFSQDSKQLFTFGKSADLWQVQGFDELIAKGCNWVIDYLNNPQANLSNQERQICQNIKNPK